MVIRGDTCLHKTARRLKEFTAIWPISSEATSGHSTDMMQHEVALVEIAR